MKKLNLLILLFFMAICPLPAQNNAPTDRELLLELVKQQAKLAEQVTETNKQIAETNKQQAVTNAKFETRFEGIDKRFDDVNKRMDILLYIMLGLLAGIFGLIIAIYWDRRAAMRPIEEKTEAVLKENEKLKKEIITIKKKQQETDNFIKRIGEIDSRFAGIL